MDNLANANLELAKAKSNLEQYLLISTSEGEAKEQYQEYVRNNFDRVFEGYSVEQMDIVGRIFTEHYPKQNGVLAIDECVLSTLDVLDNFKETPDKDILRQLKDYTSICSKYSYSNNTLIQGNELIKHYLNTGVFSHLIGHFDLIKPDFGVIVSSLNQEELILEATQYFSQENVKEYLINHEKHNLSFNDAFKTFYNLMLIPEELYGYKPKKIIEDCVYKLIEEDGSKGDLYSTIKGVMITTRNTLSLSGDPLLSPSTECVDKNTNNSNLVNLREILTTSMLKAFQKNQPYRPLRTIYYRFFTLLSGCKIKNDDTFEKLSLINQFDYVVENLPSGEYYNSAIFNLYNCIQNHQSNFDNFEAALNFLEEGLKSDSLDLKYLEDSMKFNYHKYHGFFNEQVRDSELINYLSRPNVIEVLRLKDIDNYSNILKAGIKGTFLLNLLKTFEVMFDLSDGHSVNSSSSRTTTENEFNIKDYLINGVCDVVKTFGHVDQSSVGMIKNIKSIIQKHNADGNLMYLADVKSVLDNLLELSTRDDYQSEILPKTNEFFKDYYGNNKLRMISFFEMLKKSNSVNDFELDELSHFMERYRNWESKLFYDFNQDQRRILVETYDLLENSLLAKKKPAKVTYSGNPRRVERDQNILKGKLKGSFQRSLDELVSIFEDESVEVQKNEVVSYCRKVSELVRKNQFNILDFIDAGGVQ